MSIESIRSRVEKIEDSLLSTSTNLSIHRSEDIISEIEEKLLIASLTLSQKSSLLTLQQQARRILAFAVRLQANFLAFNRKHPSLTHNDEKVLYEKNYSFMSFTKGLAHDKKTGLVKDQKTPITYRRAIQTGTVQAFDNIVIGDRLNNSATNPKWHHTPHKQYLKDLDKNLGAGEPTNQIRHWESPTTGHVFSLEGADCQAVTMPPAPTLLDPVTKNPSDELIAEMAEVYWFALLRDMPLEKLHTIGNPATAPILQEAINHLKELEYYKTGGKNPRKYDSRERPKPNKLDANNVFRGQTSGVHTGPYLSQFLLMGTSHLESAHTPDEGILQYGAISIDLKVRIATEKKDYMTKWKEWLDVQNGANLIGNQKYDQKKFRHITTMRDMATYVHHDQLYEAYLNALFWLLNVKAPVDPNFTFDLNKTDALNKSVTTEGFALWGGPHILSLMTEVATRALKAVRYQKFNLHLRARPEALAGLMAAHKKKDLPPAIETLVKPFYNELNKNNAGIKILDKVSTFNKRNKGEDIPLLPMAFPEGSPMHPCYGAGHATVAGACVTILKAFFNENAILVKNGSKVKAILPKDQKNPDKAFAFVASLGANKLKDVYAAEKIKEPLTIGDELNKLAANISIARNMAGVHYYSDYIDSLRMGEQIAISILEEQSTCYLKDKFEMSFTTFDGKMCSIGGAQVIV